MVPASIWFVVVVVEDAGFAGPCKLQRRGPSPQPCRTRQRAQAQAMNFDVHKASRQHQNREHNFDT